MKKLFALFLTTVTALAQFSGGPPTMNNVRQVTTVAQFTNTLAALNAASIDGVPRIILMAPGTFTLASSNGIVVSNNITIQGAGIDITTIASEANVNLDIPMVKLHDNCGLSDLTLKQSNAGIGAQLGVHIADDGPSSTNVNCYRIKLVGDSDNIVLNLGDGIYDPSGIIGSPANEAIDWAIYDSLFYNKYDSIYIDGTENGEITGEGFANDARAIIRIYNCRLESKGPFTSGPIEARGQVTNLRLVGGTARIEAYSCFLYASGGTNITCIASLLSSHGADPLTIWPGGLYLNNCHVQINATNMHAAGNGGALALNTNGWVFLNGVYANSNNIVGTGSNYWTLDWTNGVNMILTNNGPQGVGKPVFNLRTNITGPHHFSTNLFVAGTLTATQGVTIHASGLTTVPATVGGTLATSTTTVGTDADSAEKDLLSYTLTASTLNANGQSIELLAWGSYGATANTKALRSKVGAASGAGGLTLLDTAGRAINGGDWVFSAMITRSAATTLKGTAMFMAPGFTTNDYASFTLGTTTNNFIRITGSNHTAAANDLVLEGYKIKYSP